MSTSSLINWQNTGQKISTSFTANIKFIVFVSALLFISGFFILNWYFLYVLKNQFHDVTDREARLYTTAISENLHISELNWAFAEVLQKSKFPIIITDKYNTPVNWKNIRPGLFALSSRQINNRQNFHQLTAEDQMFLKKEITRIDKVHQPLELFSRGTLFGYFHYGEVRLLKLLSWMPLLEILALFLFLSIGYSGYHVIRAGDRNILWIALAKETAHQMGTPLSSLMGWMEFLKHKIKPSPENNKTLEILDEIDSDIARLTKVSIRFSQIGSVPKLKLQPVNTLIQATVAYFGHRLPQAGKKVDLELALGKLPDIWMNRELIGWVLENLIKNSLDSIQNKNGTIKIESFFAKAEETVHLSITDNGKGIERENWNKVFQTGFSTKKRGWGLGLSLAWRIITIYHGGSIFVEWSDKFRGTQIKIILPVVPDKIKKGSE